VKYQTVSDPVPDISTNNAEQAWWDQYGEVNESIWQYNPYLTHLIRGAYLDQMFDFLHRPGGKLLDFGCGNGWVSRPFAEKEMEVVGIDLSGEQIARATQYAAERGITARYIQGDLSAVARESPFDSIIIHSLLHHIPDALKRDLLSVAEQSLRAGGRVFLYEPIAADPNRPWWAAAFDKAMLGLFRLMEYSALFFGLLEPKYAELKRGGWQMVSPSENPILRGDLLSMLPESLQLISISYWHGYAVKYANLCMALRQPWQNKLQHLAPLFCHLDDIVLNSSLRDATKVWPMASLLLEKIDSREQVPR